MRHNNKGDNLDRRGIKKGLLGKGTFKLGSER